MKSFLQRHWFLVALAITLLVGGGLGTWLGETLNTAVVRSRFEQASRVQTAIILFLMALTLDTRKLVDALRSPRAVLWASLVNFLALPLLAWPVARWQLSQDYLLGVIITASVPSTMASASVWTRKAGGNDAVSLLVTILTNGLCFVLTPLWLHWSIGAAVQLDTQKLIVDLVFSALLPIAVGQICRQFSAVAAWSDRYKGPLSAIAQICILIIILRSAMKAGPKILETSGGGASGLLRVVGSMAVLHLAAIAIAWYGGRLVGLSREDAMAAAFSGSQKTLPIGVYLASLLSAQGAGALAVFPILVYHVSQLVIDSVIADRLSDSLRPTALTD